MTVLWGGRRQRTDVTLACDVSENDPLASYLPPFFFNLMFMLFCSFQGVNKSEKKMKLTLKGGAAVDPDSGEQRECCEQSGAALARADQEMGWQWGPALPCCQGSPSPGTLTSCGEPPEGGVRVARRCGPSP